MRVRTVLIPGLAAALSTAFVAGCADDKKAAETPKTEAAEAEPAKAEDVEIVLAKADEFDGAADRIVSKCSSCGLGMDGKAEHAVSAHGYTLHFCSDGCKTGFSQDLDTSLLALKVPDKP